ncbi:Serine/threonine-protein kinase AFC1 [Glycine soja]
MKESNEDINHRLVCAKLELIAAKMEANAKIKKYEETVKHLYKLLKKVCQERDEARDQLQLIRNFQASTPAETSSTVPQVDHHACLQYKTKPSLNSTKVSYSSSKVFSNHPCDLSLSSLLPNEKHSSTRIAEPSNLTLPKQPNHMKADIGASRDNNNNMVDGASLVFDKLVCGKPLPQKGRLLQSVTEAGPLLQTLLVAPAPQWQNPPSLSSSGLTLGTQDNSSSTTNTDDKASVNPNGFIPTSLSLAFPGNSHGPSQMSSASGFGLALKNEQRIIEFPHRNMDKRPRKKQRLTWDMHVPPPPPPPPPLPPPKVLPTMYCKQEVGNGVVPNHAYPSLFYRGMPRNGSPPWRPDDKDGHYVFAVGENLTPRYKILSKMGEGTFGQVLECLDNEKEEIVAIKVVRSINKYREAARTEIEVLLRLARHDVDVMHDLCLIHTDLKPENILLISSEFIKVPDYKFLSRNTKDGSYFKNLPKSSAIKLIDFGSTSFEHQDHSYVVSTRHYRAPEVILGLGWNYPCDLWSVGCILVELCSGEALFQTHENLEHLAMMERVLGPLPPHMVVRADRRAEKYFKRGTRLSWPDSSTSRESMRAVWKLPRLPNLIMQHVDHSAGDLIDLLQGLLRYDPSERLKAKEALRHPFFFTRDTKRYGYPL